MVRKVFTTGQVAKICSVTTQTVTKWVDSGRLKGYRIPGSRARRVARANLLKFIKDHDVPTDYFSAEKYHLLVVGGRALAAEISKALAVDARFKVQTAPDLFCTGLSAAVLRPAVVLVDADEAQVDAREASRLLEFLGGADEITFVAVAALPKGQGPHRQLAARKKSELANLGYKAVAFRPIDSAEITGLIHKLCGVE